MKFIDELSKLSGANTELNEDEKLLVNSIKECIKSYVLKYNMNGVCQGKIFTLHPEKINSNKIVKYMQDEGLTRFNGSLEIDPLSFLNNTFLSFSFDSFNTEGKVYFRFYVKF